MRYPAKNALQTASHQLHHALQHQKICQVSCVQSEVISTPLGALPRLVQRVPSHAVVRGRDAAQLTGDLACTFTAVVTSPSITLHEPALLQVALGTRACHVLLTHHHLLTASLRQAML